MSRAKMGLLVVGAAFEFVGIIALAFPDLVPYGLRFSQWQQKRTLALLDRIRRILGRPRSVVIEVGAASVGISTARVSAGTSVSAAAPLEQKVAFLLSRDEEVQRDVDTLRERIEAVEAGASKRLEQSRREIETRFAQELKAALEAYRPLRIWGAVALLLGLVCVTYANFID